MSHEERNTVFQILVGIGVNAYIIWRLLDLADTGAFDGPDAVTVWAKTVLWVVLFGVIFSIVAVTVGNILFAIINMDPNPCLVVDERDKMIANTGNKVTVICVCLGFMGSVIAMAFGLSAIGGLSAILLSFSIGSLIGEIGKLIQYRMAI